MSKQIATPFVHIALALLLAAALIQSGPSIWRQFKAAPLPVF